MSTSHASDPFATTTAFLTLPPLHDDSKSTSTWQGFHLDRRLENEIFWLDHIDEECLPTLETGIFQLKLDENKALSPVETSSVSEYATADEEGEEKRPAGADTATPADPEDVWTLPNVTSPAKTPVLKSWDHFVNDTHQEPPPTYLSEAGASAFDAVVQATCRLPNKRVKLDGFLNALYELALGRSSALFVWDGQACTFKPNLEAFTVTGFILGTLQTVVEEFKAGGELFRQFSTIQQHRPVDDDATSSAELIAFRAVLRSCLLSIETYMELQKPSILTVLGLRRVFDEPLSLLQICKQLSDIVQQGTPTGAAGQLQRLFHGCLACTMQHPRFRPLINHVLAAVCAPTLRSLGAALGLGRSRSLEPGVKAENLFHDVLAESNTLLQMAKETHESLQLLGKVAPERLSTMTMSESDQVLRLAFSWNDLNRLQQDASNYEREARLRIQKADDENEEVSRPRESRAAEDAATHQDNTGGEKMVLPRLDTFSSEIFMRRDDEDETRNVALKYLTKADDDSNFLVVPLGETLDLSLSPFIIAQHRLVSSNILEVLFSRCRFGMHLHLLRQIYLFGDGTFTAKLAMALFGAGDDEAGLRLQTRDSWPPASSELRLALMGVLSESVRSSALEAESTGRAVVRELVEDTTSFAIRDLSEDELEACRDVNSIHALDFLKLQYKPSNPLLDAAVATGDDSLGKYDVIFTHLLRVLRVKTVAQNLTRRREGSSRTAATTRFHMEIQHFAASLADYCANVAISLPWERFQRTVEGVESKVRRGVGHGHGHGQAGLELLRQVHDSTLDDILRGLLLVRRSSSANADADATSMTMAMHTLETLFNLVLAYAAAVNNDDEVEVRVETFRLQFRHHVRRFTSLVATVVAAAAAAATASRVEGGGIDPLAHLLLVLDFDNSGYWKG